MKPNGRAKSKNVSNPRPVTQGNNRARVGEIIQDKRYNALKASNGRK